MTMPASPREALSCQDFDACLHLFVDGELEPGDQAAFEDHLLACPRCTVEVATLRGYKSRLRAGAFAQDAAVTATDRLRSSLQSALAKETSLRRQRALRPYVLWPVAVAAMAAGFLLVVKEFRGRQERADLVAAAIENHQRNLPLEVQDSTLPNVQSWFHGKLAFAPNRIPQLGTVVLLGGRLSHLRDRDVAYVSYGFGTPDQRRVSLFVMSAPEFTLPEGRHVANQNVMVANQRGYNVAMWKDNEIVYSLVSDLEEQDILALIAATKR